MAKLILVRIGIVLIGLVVIGLGRGLFFYRGFYSPPPGEMPSYESFTVPTAPTSEFTDNHTQGEGIILIDLAHKNDFEGKELNVLLLRLVSRGLTIKYFDAKDDLKKELLAKVEEPPDGQVKVKPAAEELKPADAFIVVSPSLEFSKEEIKTVEEFVKGGGKVLFIADPTRSSQVNSLAIRFGLIFESDYLYNMKENEINYRNIFVSDFKENDITKELKKIALYTAGSISSDNASIAFVDQNTFSSVIESGRKLAPLALAQESKVLALYDLTFITEPYNSILDNNRLISNIADWLIPPAKKAKP
ncbi:MAG: hypothetical protein HY528_00140 [Chloroflexi bacterium]|nr:hypothetical protein [Chloroflexota bacterium]